MKYAIKQGFFVRLFFIATEEPTINIKRIALRFIKGGHEVPISKIISRHYKSIKNCQKIINLVDRIYIYDNSIDNTSPKIIFRVINKNKDEQIVKQYEVLKNWTKVVFSSIQTI